jgi:hypothetical protein
MRSIYLIGSLRNPEVPEIAKAIRKAGHDCFDDWYAAGPEADDYWRTYEKDKGNTYKQALAGYAANHVWEYDHFHLDRCDTALLVLPAGKSGHLELGYSIGAGKTGIIRLDKDYDRWDVMYRFAQDVCENLDEVLEALG